MTYQEAKVVSETLGRLFRASSERKVVGRNRATYRFIPIESLGIPREYIDFCIKEEFIYCRYGGKCVRLTLTGMDTYDKLCVSLGQIRDYAEQTAKNAWDTFFGGLYA